MNLTPENTMERILNGEDVTPSCRAEYFVKKAIDNAGSGGGGDTYETVTEIAVGQMEEQGGMYIFDNVAIELSGVSADDALYFNSEEYPLTRIENEGIVIYGYNFNESGISGTPAYGIVINQTDGDSIISATSIENTTVKILKKVSGGGSVTVDSALSETSENPVQNKVITAALEAAKPLIVTATLDTATMEIMEASASLPQVLAAAASGQRIAFQLRATSEIDEITVRAFDTFTDSSIKAYSDGTGEAVFSAVSLDDGTPTLCRIVAASGDHDGQWIYDETPLATVTP